MTPGDEQVNVALKEYIEQRLDDFEKLVDEKFASVAKATDKSEAAYNSRFALANEFRQAMSDLSGTFITRDVHDTLKERVSILENKQSNLDGKIVGWSVGVGFIVTVINLIITFSGG